MLRGAVDVKREARKQEDGKESHGVFVTQGKILKPR